MEVVITDLDGKVITISPCTDFDKDSTELYFMIKKDEN